MGKHKTEGKDKKKGSQLVLRLDKAERDDFVSLCERLDTSAAREIRRFMREFVSANMASEPATDVEQEPAVSADAPAEVLALEEIVASETDAAADAPAEEPEKPKKKPKRV